jgi:hypothetical protein
MEIRLPSVGEIRLKYGGNTIEIHLPTVGEIIDSSSISRSVFLRRFISPKVYFTEGVFQRSVFQKVYFLLLSLNKKQCPSSPLHWEIF